MSRSIVKKKCVLTQKLKEKMLLWAQQSEEVVWLDSNDYLPERLSYQAILAVDAFTSVKTDFHNAFSNLDEYQQLTKDWLFGYLSYDLKNDVERLHSGNFDGLNFPDLYFFQPKKVFLFSENEVEIHYLSMVEDEIEQDWQDITSNDPLRNNTSHTPVKIRLRTSKDSYFEKVERILEHIHKGDIYEVNFCQEFFATQSTIAPIEVFFELNRISKPPFASFVKIDSKYILSASPERYLKKTGKSVISQPIKGTAKRMTSPKADAEMIKKLRTDPKERSENIMITDLVRNDLSRIAKKGSVEVSELCEIYTFEQVHQMISTVYCEVDASISPVEIIKNTFPMGSMTGAPKIRAMKIIELLEDSKRGVYSGAIGYFTPNDDFDFNVVIRSILYDSSKKYISFSVGGAITSKSIIENEYEECLLKAKAMREVLG